MRPGTPGFIGARLRQGREARGLSASALSDLVGVTRAAISQYEGKVSPSPDVVRRICLALNLPIQWFLRPITARKAGTLFFRCMASATKTARVKAERRYDWLRDLTALVGTYITLPQVKFPDFDMPSDPTVLSMNAIEEIATQTRRFWGLQDGPISNVTWLLENNGAILTRIDLEANTLDAFSEWEPTENRPYVILGAHKGSACRSRFDAAHELAHLVLHRNVPDEQYQPNAAFRLMEEQCHRFAGAFLLPAATLDKEFHVASLDGLLSLKQRWRVSLSAIIMRLGQLDIISSDQKQNLFINLGRRKWRTSEPLDDILEPEQPRLLRRSIELLINKGVIGPDEFIFRLGLPSQVVENLAALPEGYSEAAAAPLELNRDGEQARILRFPTTQ